KAINELCDLVSKIINSLNGNHLVITADHGFLFQETPPGETDKNTLASKPASTLLAKKRYLLGRTLPASDQAWHGTTAVTAGAGGGMEFWVPKGANRFHFVGGSRFVHGGAMPQEVVVPIIRVHHIKETGSAAKTRTRTVGVSVLGSNFKVTTNRCRFQLIQTEPVGERVKPVTLKVAIYDGADPVTNVETLTFDSPSTDMNQWKKTVSLTLEGRRFDSKKVFQLILRDTETGVEEARFDVTIDLAFINDF
ncbi:MAG: PglZ domain-containing protein, partial [Rhodoferax sp.]|nr:PglZ domain-containing protein [Rhodoferax sp.]